jgi:hypothetical protein
MAELPFALVIFVIIALIAVAVLFFGGWVVVNIFRLLIRGIFGPQRIDAGGRFASPAVLCRRERCRAMNPSEARFCRRCGVSLHAETGAVRRVAMW